MKCFSQIVVAMLLVAALAFGTSNVTATPIPVSIANQGFDNQSLANGKDSDTVGGGPTGWSISGGSSWWVGALNPLGSDSPDNGSLGYIGASDNGTPQGGNGANVGELYCPGTGTVYLQQTLNDTLKTGTYKLTVAVGHLTNVAPLPYLIGIGTTDLASDEYLESYSDSGSSLSAGSLMDKSVTLNVTKDNSHLSQAIVITLYGSGTAAATDFDNVRLTYIGIPEPNTLVLSVAGLIGLLAYAWRKRKCVPS